MPFNNKRNSRDDNSGKSRRPTSRTPYEKGDRNNDKQDRPYGSRPSSPSRPTGFRKDSDRPYNSARPERRDDSRPQDDRPYRSKDSRSFSKDDRPYKKDNGSFSRSEKPYKKDDRPFSRDDKPFRKDFGSSSTRDGKPFRKDDRPFSRDNKPFRKEFGNPSGDRKPFRSDSREQTGEKRPFNKDGRFADRDARPTHSDRFSSDEKPAHGKGRKRNDGSRTGKQPFSKDPEDGLVRLNRYIANSGICSRRKADELIEAGVVSVNGEVVSELGTKVDPAKDEIRYNGERLKREKMIYVLLNKPKDYITTTDDPQERRTVMHLVEKASRERIYPIGRLDRNTTGLLLMTNDGHLAEKLSHPRNNISKIYNVELNKNLTQGDLNKIQFGLELEDGFVKPDDVSYVQGASKREVGIQIHSGKNRIVRRIFEHLGYEVLKLDRVIYANLTKKDLPRGRWRYLEEKEIIQLKHLIK